MACASPSELSHQNFKEAMQLQVGRSIEDRYLSRNRYPARHVASKALLNGNTEEEFYAGHGLRCRVFFEIDNKAGKIVGWRYEGTKEDCAIPP
jgi:hypothetical protein